MGETLVWDSEARHSPRHEDDLSAPGQEGKAAWARYKSYSGISVAVVWSYDTKEFDFYSDRDQGDYGVEALAERLASADCVISYCGDYDRTVLEHCLDVNLSLNECDLHEVIRDSVKWQGWSKGDWKLGRVAQDTLGITKTADGAMAPSMVTNENYAQLYKYCMQDVVCTRDLWLFMHKYGYVIDPQMRRWEVRLRATASR